MTGNLLFYSFLISLRVALPTFRAMWDAEWRVPQCWRSSLCTMSNKAGCYNTSLHYNTM